MTIKVVGEPKQQTLILTTNEVIESPCVQSCNNLFVRIETFVFYLVFSYSELDIKEVQCNLDLVTLLVSEKTVTKLHKVAKLNDFI